MYNKGQVSIWIGNFNSLGDLEKYIQTEYIDDSVCLDSRFETDFNIEYYDEDFREINILDNPQDSFRCLLQEHSYCNSIISNYTKNHSDYIGSLYNSVILLYNYKYDQSVKEIEKEGIYIKYIGSVEYDEKEY